MLRKTLDDRGFNNTRIVAADMIGSDSWEIVSDMMKDKALNNSIDFVGYHIYKYLSSIYIPVINNIVFICTPTD